MSLPNLMIPTEIYSVISAVLLSGFKLRLPNQGIVWSSIEHSPCAVRCSGIGNDAYWPVLASPRSQRIRPLLNSNTRNCSLLGLEFTATAWARNFCRCLVTILLPLPGHELALCAAISDLLAVSVVSSFDSLLGSFGRSTILTLSM